MTGQPKIRIVCFDNDEDPFEHTVFAQRLEPNDDEVGQLLDLLPPRNSYIEMPFLTRLTSTNLTNKYVMVCS